MSTPTNNNEPSLTDEQHSAIHQRGVSISLSAGAGCGKTFVITRRLIEELRRNNNPGRLSRLVAITFTNRAAREMKNRIRQACTNELLKADAGEADYWLALSHSIDSARISTIDSFCASLIRSHAVEASVDPMFALLEQELQPRLIRDAVNDTLKRLLEEQNADCEELIFHYEYNKTHEILTQFLYRSMEVYDFPLDLGELATDWETRWINEVQAALIQEFLNSSNVRELLALFSEYTPSHPVMAERCANISAALAELPRSDQAVKLLNSVAKNAMVKGGGLAKAWPNAEIYKEVQSHFDQLKKDIKKLAPQLVTFAEIDHESARLGLIALRLSQQAREAYEARKQTLGVLDFGDLLRLATKLLRDFPEVRASIASGIDLLIIDEFQDTSPLQVELVRLLRGESLKTGGLLIVGDFKQSIYRFRDADPTVFHALREELPSEGRLSLTTNFRSRREILDFVNAIFDVAMPEEYEPLRAGKDFPALDEPAIEFLFPRPEKQEGKPSTKDNAEEQRQREAEAIAKRIRQLLEDPAVSISDENGELRRVRPGDICLLFRTRSNFNIYEEALRKANLDYYVVGSRAFYAQQEVQDLAMLCQWLGDPADELSLVGVLRSPMFNIDDETLLILRVDHGSVTKGLFAENWKDITPQQQEQVRFAALVLLELRKLKSSFSLEELLRHAITRTGYDAAMMFEFLGERKLANLEKLVSMAAVYDRSGRISFSEFADRLRASVLEQSEEALAATQAEESDVIGLMTIHQAKGLEFPIVFVVDLNAKERPQSPDPVLDRQLGPLLPVAAPMMEGIQQESNEDQPGDLSKYKPLGMKLYQLREQQGDEAERLRLLYVALTRAKERLILSAGLPENGKLESAWLKTLSEIYDLDTGEPLVTDAPPAKVISSLDQLTETEPNKQTGSTKHIRLCDLRELVESAPEEPLPWKPVPPSLRTEFSVTEVTEGLYESAGHRHSQTGTTLDEDVSRDDPRLLGTAVHQVLELVPLADLCDATKVWSSILERIADEHDVSVNALQRAVEAIGNSDLPQQLQQARQVHREVDFALSWPVAETTYTLSGQIDGLYQMPDRSWHVIDYKVISTSEKGGSDLIARYAVQLQLYALAVQEVLGLQEITAKLVSISGDQASLIPIDTSPKAIDDMRANVSNWLANQTEMITDE
ncbi:UvrD-helicase domain-containing protein [Calycomorphotria hydatis]|uniref:DNA 3'-5' helicase n=1 Tax=Calycomorphotria hydatis TaxID=2528027 RepID=A0A517T9H7_9PLAN|nr:UvrD-helicase domain-containing protein [Calycomorphotria hydatis]QDT65009.1 ATP-dependent helicase/nuclease subunit A [Calycomorphotria hydatis]